MSSSHLSQPASPPFTAFPARPLELARKNAVVMPMVWWFLLGIAFAAGGVFLGSKYLPGLVKEGGLRNAGATTEEVELRDGKCKTSKAIFTDCTGNLRFRTLPEHGSRVLDAKLDYMLMFDLDDDIPMFVKYDPAHPEVNTTSWGLNHYWNRVGMALGLSGLLVVLGIATGFQAFTPLRRRRALTASLASPSARPTRLSNLRRNGKKITATVHHFRDGKERKFDQTFRADEEPLFLGQTDHALALVSPDGVPTVLDSSLSDLKLSAEERERILVAANAWPERG